MHHFHAITPIVLLFHESRPEKRTNHIITPSAGDASPSPLLKEETPTEVFPCEICEIFKNTFFTEHLWWLLLSLWQGFNIVIWW